MRRVETPEGRSVRLLRVGEQVRHVLSELLQRGDVHDDVLQSHLVSVTEVRMSPDLRHATVFVKPLLGQDEEAVLAVIDDEARGVDRIDRLEHRGVSDHLDQAEDRDDHEPQDHHRSEHRPDACRAPVLEQEEQGGAEEDRSSEECGQPLLLFVAGAA